jgi:signal transduction histidine kinase
MTPSGALPPYPEAVPLPRLLDLAWVAAAGVVTAALVVLDPAAGALEWVFGTFLLALAGFVVGAVWRAVVRAGAQRSRASRLSATQPGAVALAAIREERRRLAEEITAVLRDAFQAILVDVEALAAGDPRPGLRRIHSRTRVATSDLRRQLGLLRAPRDGTATRPPPAERRRPPTSDVSLAVGLATLAVVEVPFYAMVEDRQELLPWSAVLSALAAACVVGRTVAPALACFLCAGVFVAGSVVGFPVAGGFWFFGTVGTLVWTVAARARFSATSLVAALLLVATVAGTRRADDPSNYGLALALLVLAGLLGLLVRVALWRERRSRSRADVREGELAEAAREAVEAERAEFARELHDVTSHAVGLIAVQSAAAQVSWPHDPEGVRQSVALVEQTALAALAELDRLGAGGSAVRGAADLHQLVGRIRASGTDVELSVVGELPPSAGQVVHRVVQESLTNAVRHAAGARVLVAVESGPDGVAVSVQDDGTGPSGGAVRGYGLVGLQERVALAGGTLRTGSAPGGGFLVEAVLPVASPVGSP